MPLGVLGGVFWWVLSGEVATTSSQETLSSAESTKQTLSFPDLAISHFTYKDPDDPQPSSEKGEESIGHEIQNAIPIARHHYSFCLGVVNRELVPSSDRGSRLAHVEVA